MSAEGEGRAAASATEPTELTEPTVWVVHASAVGTKAALPGAVLRHRAAAMAKVVATTRSTSARAAPRVVHMPRCTVGSAARCERVAMSPGAEA